MKFDQSSVTCCSSQRNIKPFCTHDLHVLTPHPTPTRNQSMHQSTLIINSLSLFRTHPFLHICSLEKALLHCTTSPQHLLLMSCLSKQSQQAHSSSACRNVAWLQVKHAAKWDLHIAQRKARVLMNLTNLAN